MKSEHELSVNSSYMRLHFFHFMKSNRHGGRDRPMDETREAKRGKQTAAR